MKVRARLLAIAFPLILASLANGAASESTNEAGPAQVVVVKIENFTFEPATVKVHAGTQIKWINEDDVPHTVTGSEAGSPLHSSALDSDDSYTATIDSAGTYKYFCAIHPHMVGTVIVEK